MTFAAILTILVVLAVLVTLAATRVPPDVLLMAAVTVLIVGGAITPMQALAGFGNTGLMTVAALYVVAAGLRETGAVQWVAKYMLGQPANARRAQMRLIAPASILSAFLNNTTVVAMFIPAVQQWAQKLKIPPSKLLMILSYAAILGGTCTLIGTSTNLVVDGLLRARGYEGFRIFDLAWVGVPLLVIGGAYMVVFANRLLPGKGGVADQLEQVREYAVEVVVDAAGPLTGKSIAQAGLRHLAHGYLAEITRGARVLAAVGPDTVLEGNDILLFVGAPDCAKELRAIQGLQPATGSVHKLDVAHHQRCLVEAVVSPEFPNLGRSVRAMQFRTRYGAAILAVFRAGEPAREKVGDIELEPGDTLLLETGEAFVEQYRNRRDFLLVSPITDSTPPDFRKAPRALAILGLMVAAAAFEWVSMLEAAFLAAGAMLITRCVTPTKGRMGINLPVLIVIGAAFALGAAMTETGVAAMAATALTAQVTAPLIALALIYILTAFFTELITNNAAAVLMFSIAIAVAESMGVSPMPFVVAVMFGASAAFLTPIGYQTNLMVMGPGGYRLLDYLRLGSGLSLIAFTVSITLIPRVWPFL